MMKVSRIFFIACLILACAPAIYAPQSQADGYDPACNNPSAMSFETASRLYGTFKTTSDSQISIDLCGNALATMHYIL